MAEILPYRHETSPAWVRRLRRYFTREALIDFLKTFMWVAPLSVLIWVYADRNTTVRRANLPIGFDVVSTDPTRVITIVRGAERTVTAELSGSKTAIETVENQLPTYQAKVKIGPEVTLGPQNYPLTSAIRNASLFQDNALAVSNVSPASIEIIVDELIKKQVDVVPPEGIENLADAPEFVPAQVTITGPRRVLEAANLEVIADFSRSAELRQPGQHRILAAVRPSIVDEHVSIEPQAVNAIVTVKQEDETFALSSVAVKVALFRTDLDQYRVECNDVIHNVRVSGPPDQIRRLKPGATNRFAYFAVLSIEAGEKPDQALQKPLEMILPEGVRVVSEDLARLNFDYKLVDKQREP